VVDDRLRVLITGGAGFIGSRVAAAALDGGADVTILDDFSTGDPAAVPVGASLVVADVREPAVVDEIARVRPARVIHAAAQVSVARSVEDPELDAAVNVRGTELVLEGSRRAGVERIVFLSSGGAVYGETDGAGESDPVEPKSPYGRDKLAAEGAVRASGMSHAIARLANVYGPGQRADLEGGVVAILIEHLLAGDPIEIHGDGEQRRDFIHVDDASAAILALAGAPMRGIWNVGTARTWSIRELLAELEALIGPAVSIREVEPRVGDVRNSRLLIDRIRAEIGWQPRIDLPTGLRATLDARDLSTGRR
jgi:UDP-glucose 4-epimerase